MSVSKDNDPAKLENIDDTLDNAAEDYINEDEVKIFCLGDANEICRLCLATEDLYTLEESPLLDNFREISRLNIKLDDKLPASICETCLDRLVQFQRLSDFINRCSGVQKILGKLFDTVKLSNNIPTITLKNQSESEITVIKDDETSGEIVETSSKLCEKCGESTLGKYSNENRQKVLEYHCSNCDSYPKAHKVALKQCSKCKKYVENLLQHRRENINCRCICNICGLAVSTINRLRVHLITHKRSHQNRRCNKCDKTFKYSRNLNRHKALHDFGKRYKCELCPKVFSTNSQLQEHTNNHTGDKPLKCNLCDEKFTGVKARAAHSQKVHNIPPKLKLNNCSPLNILCFVCGKKYKTRAALKVHFRNHEGKYLSCEQCPFRCIEEASMIRHRRIHSGEKPYHCDQCPKSFRQSGHLKTHLNAMHSKESKYKCHICARTFSYVVSLKEHERRHRGENWYKCHVCHKGFYSASSRKKHVLLHGAEEVENIKKNEWKTKPECDNNEKVKDEKLNIQPDI